MVTETKLIFETEISLLPVNVYIYV